MKSKKIICILFLIAFFVNLSTISFAKNDNTKNKTKTEKKETNTIDINTDDMDYLNKQRNEVKEQLDDANSKLEYVKSEMSDKLLEIQKLDDKIRKYAQQNSELKNNLNTLQTSINQISKKLETVTEDYNKKDKLLRERLVTFYETGSISYLDVLLSANSLSEFLSFYYNMVELAEYDNNLMEKVAEERDFINNEKIKLETESKELKTLKAQAEQAETIYHNMKALKNGYLNDLSQKEKKLNEKITKYKNEKNQLETRIREIGFATGEFSIQYTGGDMIWPVALPGTYITSYYGTREHPMNGVNDFHLGIDIGNVGFGAPVVAAMDGVVTYAGELGSYGNCVMIYHGNGIITLYGHGQKIVTDLGKNVKQGDLIMEAGSTGNSTGPHLHFEVRIDGNTTNPLDYVKEP